MWKYFSRQPASLVDDVRKTSNRILRIKSLNFVGTFSESMDGKYLIACQDADQNLGRGGFRDSGNGRFALVEGQSVLFSKDCQRPNYGKVSNNGTVVVSDLLFSGEVGSKLLAFDVTGKQFLDYRFMAKTEINGLSDDGLFAATYSYSDSEDDRINLFDVEKGTLLNSFSSESGVPQSFKFDHKNWILFLCYRNGRSYRYSFAGKFLDSTRYQKERVEDASAIELVLILQEKMNGADFIDADELSAILKLAHSKGCMDILSLLLSHTD